VTQLPLRPIARNSDPSTSHEAAAHVRASGLHTRQTRETLEALAAWEHRFDFAPPTSFELAAGDYQKRLQHARRLADLRELGLVAVQDQRRCAVTGRTAQTWVVTQAGWEALAGLRSSQ